MPKQKDLKRLTRARMEKTGESYTAARGTLIAKRVRRGAAGEGDAPEPPPAAPPAPAAPTPAAPPDYAALSGVSEETILARTGHGWRHWVEMLDAQGAHAMPHGEIAELVHRSGEISGWWSQAVTVGYERIKGLRAIGQRRDGAFEATKSKTLAVPLDTVRRAFTDPALRARWLPGTTPTLRKSASPSSLRLTWDDGTAVDVWLTPKGDAKTQLAIAHGKLASKAEAEERKAYWGERLGALGEVLAAEG